MTQDTATGNTATDNTARGSAAGNAADGIGNGAEAAATPAPAGLGVAGVAVEDFPGGLRACLEAILMAADQPQSEEDLARVLGVNPTLVGEAQERMQSGYDAAQRGFELRHTARGWQYASRAAFEPVVAAFVTDGQTARLSQAALEALAIIAYKQPVTRAQVAALRGVNSDGLIREDGVDEESRAALLVTSNLFLERMGLDGLDQLPSLAPFLPDSARDVEREASQAAEIL